MGDVYRIIYAHVPAMWMALIAATLNVGASLAYLFKASWKTDALAEASAELGLLFGVFGMVLGLAVGQAHLGRLLGLGSRGSPAWR